MEWYQQHPPQPIEEVSYNDYLQYKALNTEPSAYHIFRMYEVNEAIHKVIAENEMPVKSLETMKRKKMATAGKQRLNKGNEGGKAINY